MLGSGEVAAAHVIGIFTSGSEQGAAQVGVLLDEPGHLAAPKSKGVLPDQDLPVALVASADADRGNPALGSDLSCDITRHHFHHDAECPRRGQSRGVVEHPLGGLATSLHPIATQSVLALRGEADVTDDRDTTPGQLFDLRDHLDTPFEFYAVGASLLEEPNRGVIGLLRGALVGAEGKIADNHRAFHAP